MKWFRWHPVLVGGIGLALTALDTCYAHSTIAGLAESVPMAVAGREAERVVLWTGLIATAALVLLVTLQTRAQRRAVEARRVATDAAAASEASERKYRALLEHASDGVLIIDPDFVIRYANPAVARALGHSASALLGRRVADLCDPDELREHPLQWPPAGRALRVERRIRRCDGTYMTVEVNVMRTGDGNAEAVVRDMTERVAAQRALKQAHDNLAGFIAAAPLAIVVVDTGRLVQGWNAAAERLFGWSAEEVLGKPIPTVPSDREGEFDATMERQRQGQHVGLVETRRQRKDGSEVEVLASAAPLRNERGEVTGVIGLFADLTERKQLETRLRQAQKMEAIGQLAGGIAHDFNNILTSIKGFVGLLEEGCPRCGAELDDLREIGRAADRAASLTSQLLAFSRKQVMKPRVFDAAQAVEDIARMLRRLMLENIQVDVRATEGCLVYLDPTQFEQVILNLAVNARDAMPDGGHLAIDVCEASLGPRDARRFGGSGVTAGPKVAIVVRDTGVGMSEDVLARVYEPFFTTKSVGEGTGLGLATVYGIVKQNEGFIEIQSRPGEGTTAYVYFPAAAIDAVQADAPRPAKEEHPRGDGRTILVVEDEPAIRAMAVRVLEKSGYRVLTAGNGREVVERARAYDGPIDLLLTDVVLPEMSGPAAARIITEERPNVRVLFTSGYPDTRHLGGAVLPADAVLLQKPFSMTELLRRVRSAMA